MPELIDKKLAYAALKHEQYTHCLSFTAEAFEKAARIIDQMPTIDAKVIQHGKWIQCSQPDFDYNIVAKCSICGAQEEMCDAALETGEVRWCWKCGARMDGGADNA